MALSCVPAGTFRSGAIFLKQGVDLLVEKDGVLKGTTNLDDYPAIQSRWEGTEEMYTASLVNADGVNGLTISGEGTIDGSGDEFMANSPMRRPPPAPGAAAAPRLRELMPLRQPLLLQLRPLPRL